ncbi:MAG: porphobilinogen synthase [Legionellaceae bacterium]|nr:porphobilinogen synthase [Legionellaceae bacterium]
MSPYSLLSRPKRLRRNSATRALLRDVRLLPEQLIAPLFIHAQLESPRPISSMPGQYQLSLEALPNEIDTLAHLGIKAVLLFGIPGYKDDSGSASLDEQGIIQQAIRCIKARRPEMLVITDVCFCEYTSHGHCGILQADNEQIDNDATLALLAKQAVSHARAGADWVAPSSMTDGMVGAIRQALDAEGWQDTVILSYAVKYHSAFYGPFREAAQGAPQFGDRASYQMSPANRHEWLREAELDIQEGADILMVKPAMNYLDIICRLKSRFPQVPLCAYQVSGEYSLILSGARQGLIDEQKAMHESLTAIHRAGADMIISYFAKAFAQDYATRARLD